MCMCMCPQALELDPTNESYRANLTTVEEQLRVPNPAAAPGPPPSGGGGAGGVGGAEGGADPSAGLGGKFGGGKWVGLQSVISGWCCLWSVLLYLLLLLLLSSLLSRSARDGPEPWVHEHGSKPHPNTSLPEHVRMYVWASSVLESCDYPPPPPPPPPRDVYGSHQVPVW